MHCTSLCVCALSPHPQTTTTTTTTTTNPPARTKQTVKLTHVCRDETELKENLQFMVCLAAMLDFLRCMEHQRARSGP